MGPVWATPAPSGLSRALSASFQEFLAEAGAYARLHKSYTGISPRYLPPRQAAAWPVREDGSPLDTALKRKVLRLGYCLNPPYHFRDSAGQHRGLDHDLGQDLVTRLGRHYGVADLRLSWVEQIVPPTAGDEQVLMYRTLIAGLKQGSFDAAMSGLLILPDQPVASSCPTSVLFTNIFYTGRGQLTGLQNGSREAFVGDLARRPGEFTLLSTVNGGPSAVSAEALAAQVRAQGGQASSPHGSISQLIEAMATASSHFVVGDSVSLGYRANQPGFAGLDLNLPANDQVLQLAPFTLPGGYQQSQLSQVLSAAFQEFAAQPGRYADLYEKYLGVRREAPQGSAGGYIDQASPGSGLDRVLRSGKLRFGFWRHEPYYFTSQGKDVGFERELGDALGEILRSHYPGLQVEWVEQPFQSDGGGQENLLVYDALEPALLAGKFEVAFSGLIQRPDRPVAVAAPTMFFFWNVIYTGKDGLDLKAVQGTDREHFLEFLLAHPNCTLISTPGGPSQETAEQLVTDLRARGGSAQSVLGNVPQLIEAASKGSAHFIVGDAIALSALARQPGFKGLNLNLSVRPITELIAPMTALDP